MLSPTQWGVAPLPLSIVGASGRRLASLAVSAKSGDPVVGGLLVPRLSQPALSRVSAAAGVASYQQEAGPAARPIRPQEVKTARLWLPEPLVHCQLLPYFEGSLMVLVLLPSGGAPATPEGLAPISDVGQKCHHRTLMLRFCSPCPCDRPIVNFFISFCHRPCRPSALS